MKGKAIYELKERDHRPSNTILIEGERKHRGINPVTSRRVEQYEIMPCLRALLISGKLYSLKAKSARTATCKLFGIKAGTLLINQEGLQILAQSRFFFATSFRSVRA